MAKKAETKSKTKATKNTKTNSKINTTNKKVITKKKPQSEKKINKEINKSINIKSNNDEVTKLVQLILIVLVILGIFYIITTWVTKTKGTTNLDNGNDTEQDTIIQYDEILVGNLLNRTNEEYYVLVTTSADLDVDSYNVLVTAYRETENALRVYTARLDLAFNKNFKSEESFFDTENINEVKFKGSTLVKVQNKRVVRQFEGSSAIVDEFEALTK